MIIAFSTNDAEHIPFKYAELFYPYNSSITYDIYDKISVRKNIVPLNKIDTYMDILYIKIVFPDHDSTKMIKIERNIIW